MSGARRAGRPWIAGVAVFAALASPAASGCRGRSGGDDRDGGEDPDAPYVEETCEPDADDAFCPAYAEAYCAAHFACCEDPENRYESMALCLQRTLCICTARRSGNAFAAGRVAFDATAGAALLARLREGMTGCAVMEVGALELDGVFVGTLPEGADCSPTHTDYSNTFACGPGLYCHVTDLGKGAEPPRGDCRRFRAEGESCDIGMICMPGLYCEPGPGVDDPGICRMRLPGGMPCTEDFQCQSDFCDDTIGDVCEAIDAQDTYCVDAVLEF